MMVPRKAVEPAEPPLALYAIAQARSELVEAACRDQCAGCPGPMAPNGCASRKYPRVVAGQTWPMCPLGMLRVPAWIELRDAYLAAQVSPLQDWPDGFTLWAYQGMLALQQAVRQERDKPLPTAGPDEPNFSGRRAARPGA